MIYIGAGTAIVVLLTLWGVYRREPFDEPTDFGPSELPDEPSRWPG